MHWRVLGKTRRRARAHELENCPPKRKTALTEKAERPPRPSGEIALARPGNRCGALLPENAIVVDEAMTSGRGLMAATTGAPPHDWLGNTGGSIGIALPLAVGAAVACPARRVLCLTADGSGMYTVQALWTMAREGLNVTTVVFANRTYAVLQREFAGLGVGAPGPPRLGFVRHRPSHSGLGASGEGDGSAREPCHLARCIRKSHERRSGECWTEVDRGPSCSRSYRGANQRGHVVGMEVRKVGRACPTVFHLPRPLLVTNAFNHEWPLGNVLRGVRAKVRFAAAFFGNRVKFGTASFCLHRSTYSLCREHYNGGDCSVTRNWSAGPGKSGVGFFRRRSVIRRFNPLSAVCLAFA